MGERESMGKFLVREREPREKVLPGGSVQEIPRGEGEGADGDFPDRGGEA